MSDRKEEEEPLHTPAPAPQPTPEAEPILGQVLRVLEQNFYVTFAVAFLVWMLFVDGNDLVNQYRNYQEIKRLEEQRAFYRKRIHQIEAQRKALITDPEKLEQYAREVHRLQRPNEEVFIIEE
ncbi:MAG: septum formation initiator family protein [Bernardetiaceae bacterium]